MLEGGSTHLGRTLDTSASATEYSLPFSISEGSVWSAHFIWTGSSLTTVVTLWATNNPNASLTDDTDWVDVTGTLTMPTITTSSSGKNLYSFGNDGAYKHRFKYATSNGTGVMKTIVHGKEV